MKHNILSTQRTRIDDLSPIETVLSEESLGSIFGGGLTLTSGSPGGSSARKPVTFEGIVIKGGCGTTTDNDKKECDD